MTSPPQAATPNPARPQRRRVTYRPPEPLPLAFFESKPARAAMGARDVAEVFAVLARMGVSQRRLAALTGQSQSEISEIRAGRKVRSVDLIERIADGLSTPRGWWGLAHTEDAVIPQVFEPEAGEPLAQIASSGPSVPVAPTSAWRTARQWRPAARVSPFDAVAARHLIGLISALRASLVPRSRAVRPSRAGTTRVLPSSRLRRRTMRR